MSQGCQAQPSQDVGPVCLLSEASCCPASSCPRNPGQVLLLPPVSPEGPEGASQKELAEDPGAADMSGLASRPVWPPGPRGQVTPGARRSLCSYLVSGSQLAGRGLPKTQPGPSPGRSVPAAASLGRGRSQAGLLGPMSSVPLQALGLCMTCLPFHFTA